MSLPHTAFEMTEASQVGEARRAATRLAQQLGLDDVATGRVALIATELGGNLVRHAREGRLLLGQVDGQVEWLSLDRGPGMVDVAACLRDGYSTGGTPGTGLGAVRRLADTFDLYSRPAAGTVILARVGRPAPTRTAFAIGTVALTAPGETVCGDDWAWACATPATDGPQAAVIVADGLGHGPQASEAAQTATRVFAQTPFDDPAALLRRLHDQLRSTRGAAAALVQVSSQGLSFCGAGNISGRLINGTTDRSLLSQHGTVGLQIRRPQASVLPWPEHAVLVLHSDGLQGRWQLGDAPGLLQRHPTLIAAWLLRDHVRGRDDVTVVVLQRHAHR